MRDVLSRIWVFANTETVSRQWGKLHNCLFIVFRAGKPRVNDDYIQWGYDELGKFVANLLKVDGDAVTDSVDLDTFPEQ